MKIGDFVIFVTQLLYLNEAYVKIVHRGKLLSRADQSNAINTIFKLSTTSTAESKSETTSAADSTAAADVQHQLMGLNVPEIKADGHRASSKPKLDATVQVISSADGSRKWKDPGKGDAKFDKIKRMHLSTESGASESHSKVPHCTTV